MRELRLRQSNGAVQSKQLLSDRYKIGAQTYVCSLSSPLPQADRVRSHHPEWGPMPLLTRSLSSSLKLSEADSEYLHVPSLQFSLKCAYSKEPSRHFVPFLSFPSPLAFTKQQGTQLWSVVCPQLISWCRPCSCPLLPSLNNRHQASEMSHCLQP